VIGPLFAPPAELRVWRQASRDLVEAAIETKQAQQIGSGSTFQKARKADALAGADKPHNRA